MADIDLNRIGQRMGGENAPFADPRLTKEMEDLYGLRMEEFYRGIAPDAANRYYGPRQHISPADAAALKLDLTKVYKDLAKISNEGEQATRAQSLALQVAAIQAAGKVASASKTAEGKVAVAKIGGDFEIAASKIPLLDAAVKSIGGGALIGKENEQVKSLQRKFNVGAVRNLEPEMLLNGAAQGSHKAAQDAFYTTMDDVIKSHGGDKRAIQRIIVTTAGRLRIPTTTLANNLRNRYKTGVDTTDNQMALEAISGSDTDAFKQIERLETEIGQGIGSAMDQYAGGVNLDAQASSLLGIATAAQNAGAAGIQIPPEVLQELNMSAEQMKAPGAANDIQSAAAAQVENLFKAITEGAADIPYVHKQIQALKRNASLEGSEFREYLTAQGFDPDNPAHVDAGFNLLEEDYAKTRKYETKQAKIIADTARLRRHHQRERAAEIEHQRANRMPEGALPEGGAEPLPPQEVIQNYGPSTGELPEAGETPPAPEGLSEEELKAELKRQGLVIDGGFIPLGRFDSDSKWEYSFDTKTNSFVGHKPGEDPSTGSQFDIDASGLKKSNPDLYRGLGEKARAKVAEIKAVAEGGQPPDAAEEAQGRDPSIQREGIGVRKSQTENMEIIEKQLRAAARAARNRGDEERAGDFEQKADKYLDLRVGVTFREDEAKVQGVGTGFEQDEMLPGDEDKTLEEETTEERLQRQGEEWQEKWNKANPQEAALNALDENSPVEAGEDPVEEVDDAPITDLFAPKSLKAESQPVEVGTSATPFSTPWRRKKAYDPDELSAEGQREMGEVPTTSALHEDALRKMREKRKGSAGAE